MNDFKGKNFDRVAVNLDGYHYEKCTFTHCQLVFTGMAMPDMKECTISNPMWAFSGPACNVLNSLSVLYNADPASKAVVESIFQQIRAGGSQPTQQIAQSPIGPVN